MGDIATHASTHTASIQINVFEVGKGRTLVELPEGSLGAALLEKVGGSGKHVTARGVEVSNDTPLESGMTASVGPKSVKQGR